MPADFSNEVSDEVLALCDGVDLPIHDAQYTPEEFPPKATWGHCTVEYAVAVAKAAGAKRLALFHHAPTHDDAPIDATHAPARPLALGTPTGKAPARERECTN